MTDISQMAQVILAGMISLVPPGKLFTAGR